ncbi:uncharacterized protein C10orf143 homolog isoform 3-T6 [Trichechus inunguis]
MDAVALHRWRRRRPEELQVLGDAHDVLLQGLISSHNKFKFPHHQAGASPPPGTSFYVTRAQAKASNYSGSNKTLSEFHHSCCYSHITDEETEVQRG